MKATVWLLLSSTAGESVTRVLTCVFSLDSSLATSQSYIQRVRIIGVLVAARRCLFFVFLSSYLRVVAFALSCRPRFSVALLENAGNRVATFK